MTTQLTLYNDALLLCGERFLVSLAEEREPRRLLDQAWSSNAVKTCLEEGQWFFAMRTIQIDYDTAVEPSFGYNRAFQKPIDWAVTCGLCSDEFFRTPLTQYTDEAGYWYATLDTIYVRYVSSDVTYGLDMNKWPETFRELVAAHLATKIVLKITNDENKLRVLEQIKKDCLLKAKNASAMAGPSLTPAQGNWSRARTRFSGRFDRGNISGNLIG
jgi:hypothetical protein